MFNMIKKWYVNWRHRKVVAQEEIYALVTRTDQTNSMVKILSLHKTLNGAIKHLDKQMKTWENVQIERYGLWE